MGARARSPASGDTRLAPLASGCGVGKDGVRGLQTEEDRAAVALALRAKFRLEVAPFICASLGRKRVGWRVTPSRCGAPSLGTAGSRFNPRIKHQESPLAAFLAGSSLLPVADPQCGREAVSPAPRTQPPDVGQCRRRSARKGRSPCPRTRRPHPPFASSTEAPCLVSSLLPLLGALCGRLCGGADAGRGWQGRRGSEAGALGPRERGPATPRPAGRGEVVRRPLQSLHPEIGGRPQEAAGPALPGSRQRPGSAAASTDEPARRVWASICGRGARASPASPPARRRSPDKDAAAGSRAARGDLPLASPLPSPHAERGRRCVAAAAGQGLAAPSEPFVWRSRSSLGE